MLKAMAWRADTASEPDGAMSAAYSSTPNAPHHGAFFIPRQSLEIEARELLTTHNDPRTIGSGREQVKATLESPFEPADPVPTILAHGYFGIKSSYFDLRHYMAAMGKPAISYGEPRFLVSPLHPLETHIAAVEAIMDDYGRDQYDLSGHSMGGWIAAFVALRNPERVRSVVFNSSVGLEPHNTAIMAGRLVNFWRREVTPLVPEWRRGLTLPLERLALRGLEYVVSNPGLILTEALAVSNCDIRPQIPKISELGIKTAGIGYPADTLVLASSLERYAKDLMDEFAILPNPRAGHLAPQKHPAEVAQLHVDLANYWFGQADPRPLAA